jgi:DNA-binding transcriptional MerR regulator
MCLLKTLEWLQSQAPSSTNRKTTMRIKELSQATGVEVETIRYYEKQGLLPAPARQDNGYRDYTPDHLDRLAFIRHCRALEMPLADIRRLLNALDAAGEPHPDVDRLVEEQLDRVRARLTSMRALEKQLLLLQASCGHCDEVGTDCGILQELVAAAHGEARAVPRSTSPEFPGETPDRQAPDRKPRQRAGKM